MSQISVNSETFFFIFSVDAKENDSSHGTQSYILSNVSPLPSKLTPTQRPWFESSPVDPKTSILPGAPSTFPVPLDISGIPKLPVPLDISGISKMREVRLVDDSKKGSSDSMEGLINDEDIIILDDNDSPKKAAGRKSSRVEFFLNESSRELLAFGRESVTTHDYKTLGEDEFLNDNIINFYLKWLYEKVLLEKHQEIVHIYSSHFYTRLRSKVDKRDKSDKTRAEKAYDKVKGWTKKINIFEKRMLIFPICEESHWYLVIVCNPGHVLSQTREKDFETKRSYQQKYGETRGFNPFIMVLDSLGGSHSTAVAKIRSYLTFEHLEKKNIPLNFGKEKMAEKHPPIPLQPNSCDCGLFLCHYVELIFKDPEVFLGAMLPDLSKWFNTNDIDFKREDIALLIQKLSNEDNFSGKNVKYPKLRFPARRKNRVIEAVEAIKDTDTVTINVDEEDEDEAAPLATKMHRPDPRLKKIKGGSLGELLASKQTSRSTRFTGTYREREASPPSRRSTPPASPDRKQPSSRSSPDIEPHKKVSFEIKRRSKGAPPSPKPEAKHKNGNGSKNGSWESIKRDKPYSVKDNGHHHNSKRFTLKRNNEETDPALIKKKRRLVDVDPYHRDKDDRAPRSSKEMYDLLMKSTGKKSSSSRR